MSDIVDDDGIREELVEVGWDAGAGVRGGRRGRAAPLAGGAHQGAGGAVPRAALAGARRPQRRAPPE